MNFKNNKKNFLLIGLFIVYFLMTFRIPGKVEDLVSLFFMVSAQITSLLVLFPFGYVFYDLISQKVTNISISKILSVIFAFASRELIISIFLLIANDFTSVDILFNGILSKLTLDFGVFEMIQNQITAPDFNKLLLRIYFLLRITGFYVFAVVFWFTVKKTKKSEDSITSNLKIEPLEEIHNVIKIMQYCPNCGTENNNSGAFCSNCGNSLSDKSNQSQTQSYNDIPSNGMNILGFFLPMIGLILYAVWLKDFPKKANSIGKWSLIGFILNFILIVVINSVLFSLFWY